MKEIYVVAAVIKHGDEYLAMQRNVSKFEYMSYKYEFPGGKAEDGEEDKTALARELIEEMDMKVDIGDLFLEVNHIYPDFKINMKAYLCIAMDKNFNMKEHVSFSWLKKEDILTVDWADADIPIAEKIYNL